MARHWLSTFIGARVISAFPWGTFVVNVIGSALIGLVLASPDARINPAARQFIAVGLLGGFTTFSAFSVQTVSLLQSGKWPLALGYMVASVILCVLGCWTGWIIGRAA